MRGRKKIEYREVCLNCKHLLAFDPEGGGYVKCNGWGKKISTLWIKIHKQKCKNLKEVR